MRVPALFVSVVLALSSFLCASGAGALVISMQGWAPVGGNTHYWQDAAGSCLIREDLYNQTFPQLKTQPAALAVSNRLRSSLARKKLLDVMTQPLERSNGWGVLANYAYVSGGVKYRITQVYLSNAGRLRTISGSHTDNNESACNAEMISYLLYEAE